jgi:hypothetical protein
MQARKTIGSLFFVFCFVVLRCSDVYAAPSALLGKSVVISWSEDRTQKRGGEAQLGHQVNYGTFSVYVSSAGRLFNRRTRDAKSSLNRKKTKWTKDNDKVSSGGSDGEARGVSFQGNTLVAVQQIGHGEGARRILVNFDGAYSSCTAQVIAGKAEGVEKIGNRGGKPDLYGIKTAGASCTVKNGNVFEN